MSITRRRGNRRGGSVDGNLGRPDDFNSSGCQCCYSSIKEGDVVGVRAPGGWIKIPAVLVNAQPSVSPIFTAAKKLACELAVNTPTRAVNLIGAVVTLLVVDWGV